MLRNLIAILGVFALLTLSAPQNTQAIESEKEITVRGRLQRTVEPGGWLVVADRQKYLILNAQRFQKEDWFNEGKEVEATGETREVMTTHMEGTPLEVTTLRPLAGASGARTQQITGGESKRLTRVVVSGDSIVQAQPDTAIVTISVVTQSKQALVAQQENATKTEAVVRALKAAAGVGAEVKTSGYSLQPQRIYRENQPPTITGYEARNTVTVTLSDLSKVGTVIDATAQAGANDIAGIGFTLRKDRPARDEALAQATQEALSKARVIATALGGRLVRVVEVQEEGLMRPLPMYMSTAGAEARMAPPTPIEVGTLDITSRVQLIAEVETG